MIKKILILLITTILCILMLEISSPIIYEKFTKNIFSKEKSLKEIKERSETENLIPDDSFERVIHPYSGFTPNFNIAVGFNHNPYGLHGLSPIQKKAKNKFIVAIMGGSVAEKVYLDAQDTLISELKKINHLKDKEIILLELATPGYKQPQQLTSLVYFLTQGAEFDLLINIDGFNEIALAEHNYRNGVFPLFPMNWSIISSKNLENLEIQELSKIIEIAEKRKRYQQIISNSLINRSNFILTFWKIIDQNLNNQGLNLTENLANLKNKKQNLKEITGPFEQYSPEKLLDNIAQWWANGSLQIDKIAKANHIPYFHFLQPNQYVENSKLLTSIELQTAIDEKQSYYSTTTIKKGYKKLTEKSLDLKNSGVNFIDLSLIFKDNNETLYVDTCCHVNKRGSELIAKAVVAAIKKRL